MMSLAVLRVLLGQVKPNMSLAMSWAVLGQGKPRVLRRNLVLGGDTGGRGVSGPVPKNFAASKKKKGQKSGKARNLVVG